MSSQTPFSQYSAGEVILHKGAPADALYIIESGKVRIAAADHPDCVLADLGPGDFFGEAAILREQRHPTSVIAVSAVRALKIESAAFNGVLRENVEIAVQLMRRLVLRLHASDQRVGSPPPSAATSVDPLPSDPASASAALPIMDQAIPSAAPAEQEQEAASEEITDAPIALLLRHAQGEISVPAGKTELLVGRPDPATGAIPEINLGPVDGERTLSRRHARLLLVDGRWVLREEPGVGNGTWVNGQRVQADQTVPIKAGDALRFGAIEVELVRD